MQKIVSADDHVWIIARGDSFDRKLSLSAAGTLADLTGVIVTVEFMRSHAEGSEVYKAYDNGDNGGVVMNDANNQVTLTISKEDLLLLPAVPIAKKVTFLFPDGRKRTPMRGMLLWE